VAVRRRPLVCGGLLTFGLAVLGACSANHNPTPGEQSAGSTQTVESGSSVTTAPAPKQVTATMAQAAKGETLVATVRPAGAPGSLTPGGPPTVRVPGQWLGEASVLPVLAQQAGWVEIRLAQRPNESVAWVPAGDVSLANDAYRIVINLDTTHLQLFKRGQEVADFPVGVGLPAYPTPTGHFFVALFAAPPSPGYGPFVMVTSAHSDTISDWEESGDAITAIHGSLGSDAAIGTTGARVSHGCIRLHDVDLLQLRDVPAGTPVDIVDKSS
jgi:lipoprotein-anchoring transpeptidase ErfK/SrfK